MPIYSRATESLTLSLTPRLQKVLTVYKDNTAFDKEDIGYLIDEAAKWSTFKKTIDENRSITIDISEGIFDSDNLDLGEVIKDILQETDSLSATAFDTSLENYYLNTLPITEDYNVEETLGSIAKAFKDGQKCVKNLQKDFDQKGEGVKVIGYLSELDIYDQKFYFKADTKIKSVIKDYYAFKKLQVQKEFNASSSRLKDLDRELKKLK